MLPIPEWFRVFDVVLRRVGASFVFFRFTASELPTVSSISPASQLERRNWAISPCAESPTAFAKSYPSAKFRVLDTSRALWDPSIIDSPLTVKLSVRHIDSSSRHGTQSVFLESADMTSFGIIVIVVVASFCRPTELASCCKSATENVQRAGELSAEDQQQTWRRGVEALDRLHRFWFQRRMLEALHIDDAPVEAPVWRRRRDQQRRSVSSAERNEDGAEQDEGSVRRYTLRIIGVPGKHGSWIGVRVQSTKLAL